MFSIGEFSRISGLSIKALRLYHEKELLVPSKVDEFTGYRYYAQAEIEKARIVSYLKNMEFSLNEIKDILNNFEEEAELVSFLEKRKKHIEAKIRQYRNITFSLDVIINKEKESIMALKNNSTEIFEKDIPDLLIAGIRFKGRYEECGKMFGKIARAMGRHLDGKPLNLYYDSEFNETDADIESCFPVKQEKSVKEISMRKLPGGKCVSLVHQGPYEELGRSYQKVFDYLREHNFKSILPSREIYIKGPGMILRGNPKNYVTEIQIIVEKV